MGVDRNINQVDEDPETHEATVSVGCPAGEYTVRASLSSAEGAELAVAALEDAAPQLLQGRNLRRSVVHPHSETPQGLEHAVKKGDFNSLPHAIALPGFRATKMATTDWKAP